MAHALDDLHIVTTSYGSYTRGDTEAFRLADCPKCGGTQMAVIAFDKALARHWMRCVNCREALVQNFSVVSPAPKPLRIPAGVQGTELDVWNEVRDCLSVGAHTASVMLCRKLLMHIAVGHGLNPKDEKGFSPTFAAAVKHLESEGLVTSRMRPWVDRIKNIGNDANHELTAISKEKALDVATFTEQLLRLTYEMDALMNPASDDRQDESVPPFRI